MVKVASYNIRKAIGTDRRRMPERIIDVLNELDADVIALQEADRRFGPRHAVLPDHLLELHSDYRAVTVPTRLESMGWHGNALLVRREHHDHAEGQVVHLPCLEPRGAITADLVVRGQRLRIVGMHLDLSGLWRRRQAVFLLNQVAHRHEHEPVDGTILMGDLNEWSANRGCLADFSRHFEIAPCGRSFHARRPVASLDRIMWRGALTLGDCGVHMTPLARRASDHLPIWADFTLPA